MGAVAKGMHLLVVEDDPDISSLVDELLRDAGYDVFVARSGADALAWLARNVPALIVLDLVVPDMDGFELDARRRADARLADVPIVVTSGMPSEGRDAPRLDAVAWLPKPYRIDELLAIIRKHAHAPAGLAGAESLR